jgi:hypothetical protein
MSSGRVFGTTGRCCLGCTMGVTGFHGTKAGMTGFLRR